jgi:hypothetical protein
VTTSIVVGHSVRTWTTYDVIAATEEEVAILSNTDSIDALALAKKLDAEGRLTESNEHSDDAHDPFDEASDPAVVECEDDGVSDMSEVFARQAEEEGRA